MKQVIRTKLRQLDNSLILRKAVGSILVRIRNLKLYSGVIAGGGGGGKSHCRF